MLGADMAIAAHDEERHLWTATDYWSEGFSYPERDEQQDVTLVSVTRSHGNTLLEMRRPLVTCDAADRAVLNDTRQTLIYAYGTGALAYHGQLNRGSYDVTLIPNVTAQAAAVAASSVTLQTLELRMPSVAVPPAPTSRLCVNLQLPYDAKYHVYSYAPLIDNAPLVHHFVAYACRGSPPTPPGQAYDCLHRMECEDFYMGWAPGVGEVVSPAEAAPAFGPGGGGGGLRYLALEVHYSNVGGVEGQVDSSGFVLRYSATLKQYDMGMLTLGSNDIAVPPGSPAWSTPPNWCPGACTARLGRAVRLVDSFYHMHQAGTRMVTRHFRGGVELPPLGERRYFSFEYQSAAAVPPTTRTLLPGDSLLTTCTYSGEGRTNVTRYGLASDQEMCFNFLSYYPAEPSMGMCMGWAGLNMTACGAAHELYSIHDEAGVAAAVQAGTLIAYPPAWPAPKPYAPACARSAPGPAAGGSNRQDGAAAAAGAGGGAPQPKPAGAKHGGSVAGVVASVLILVAAGGGVGFVLVRRARRRRQADEAQHLFEKYNPNSTALSERYHTSA